MTRRTSHIAAPVALILMLVFAASASAATRVDVDKSFGKRGWATVPMPSKSYPDRTDDLTSCVPGPKKSYFVATTTESARTGKRNGGAIVKLNSRGKAVSGFGKRGVVRTSSKELPTTIHPMSDGSALVVIGSPGKDGGFTKWKVVRYTKRGVRDRKFGDGGAVTFIPTEQAAGSHPNVYVISRSRIMVADARGPRTNPKFFLSAFHQNGRPDTSFNGTGSIELPYHPKSVSPAADGKLWVTGGNTVAKLNPDSSPAMEWANGAAVAVGDPPSSVLRSYDDDSESGASKFWNVSSAATSSPDGGVALTVETDITKERDDGTIRMEWAKRLSADGSVTTSWASGGHRFLARSYESAEAGFGFAWVDTLPLKGGRTFVLEVSGDNDDPPYVNLTAKVLEPNGDFNAKASRIFSIAALSVYDYAFDSDGQSALFCGERRGRFVAARVRF